MIGLIGDIPDTVEGALCRHRSRQQQCGEEGGRAEEVFRIVCHRFVVHIMRGCAVFMVWL